MLCESEIILFFVFCLTQYFMFISEVCKNESYNKCRNSEVQNRSDEMPNLKNLLKGWIFQSFSIQDTRLDMETNLEDLV